MTLELHIFTIECFQDCQLEIVGISNERPVYREGYGMKTSLQMLQICCMKII